MARILVLVLGLAIVAFTVKFALDRTVSSDPVAASEPNRQLDSVRQRANELEGQMQRNANRADVAGEK